VTNDLQNDHEGRVERKDHDLFKSAVRDLFGGTEYNQQRLNRYSDLYLKVRFDASHPETQ
jgi:hypothetical protein